MTTMIAAPLTTTKLVVCGMQSWQLSKRKRHLHNLLISRSSTRCSWFIHTILIIRSLWDVAVKLRLPLLHVFYYVNPFPSFLFLWHVEYMHWNLEPWCSIAWVWNTTTHPQDCTVGLTLKMLVACTVQAMTGIVAAYVYSSRTVLSTASYYITM